MTTEPHLTSEELSRYSRHIALPDFGIEGQKRLSRASVLIIGAGGLGSPIAFYLAAAGVGHITIADGDRLALSNLQRQIIHNTADLDRLKAHSAAEKMLSLNPNIRVTVIDRFIAPDQMPELFSEFDFIIDATDSPTAKFAIDRAALKARKPYSHGAISQYEGHALTVLPDTARFSDLFPEGPQPQPDGPIAGPLGALPGIIGSIQAAEAIKYITGIGQLLTNRLLCFDLLSMRFTEIRLK